MGKLENLKPIKKGELSRDEAVKRGSNGGKASGKARREKKLLRETLIELLEMENKKGVTGQESICCALFKRANTGDTKAFEIIRDTIGQKPVEKIETTEKPIIQDDI